LLAGKPTAEDSQVDHERKKKQQQKSLTPGKRERSESGEIPGGKGGHGRFSIPIIGREGEMVTYGLQKSVFFGGGEKKGGDLKSTRSRGGGRDGKDSCLSKREDRVAHH